MSGYYSFCLFYDFKNTMFPFFIQVKVRKKWNVSVFLMIFCVEKNIMYVMQSLCFTLCKRPPRHTRFFESEAFVAGRKINEAETSV